MSESESRFSARPSFEQLRKQAKELKAGAGYETLAEAQHALARRRGFESWTALKRHVEALTTLQARPPVVTARESWYFDWTDNEVRLRRPLDRTEANTFVALLADMRISALAGAGHLTDETLEKVAALEHLTSLNLSGCDQITDDGLRHLQRMPQLRELVLGRNTTDRGLEILRFLPELRLFRLCWARRVSDAGASSLAACGKLERVDFMGTPVGDGAIQAIVDKPGLQRLKTGTQVTDAGLPLLRQVRAFTKWQGGEPTYSLMSADAGPTHLVLDGSFTNRGLSVLAGLEGLVGLSFFWHTSKLTSDGLSVLSALPNLRFLGCEGKLCDDAAMRHIGTLPRLRMLMAQGTAASDAGFADVARSQTIEYLWGRECPRLTGKGFTALGAMPALKGLAVSCQNVDDASLSALSRFPSLVELMPMDVSNEGFRYVGQCAKLERLWCMYCEETGDTATSHLTPLDRLQSYYAGKTQITDRSLEILGRFCSLEKMEFWRTPGITDAGLAHLARLPRLREIALGKLPRITPEGVGLFSSRVRIRWE